MYASLSIRAWSVRWVKSGVTSAVKSDTLEWASQEWTVWPASLSPEKRVLHRQHGISFE